MERMEAKDRAPVLATTVAQDRPEARLEANTDGGSIDGGLRCRALAMRVLGRPVDPGQLQHRYGRVGAVLSADELVRAGRQLDLKIRRISRDRKSTRLNSSH